MENTMKCDLCDRIATVDDSRFCFSLCDEHKYLVDSRIGNSPVAYSHYKYFYKNNGIPINLIPTLTSIKKKYHKKELKVTKNITTITFTLNICLDGLKLYISHIYKYALNNNENFFNSKKYPYTAVLRELAVLKNKKIDSLYHIYTMDYIDTFISGNTLCKK